MRSAQRAKRNVFRTLTAILLLVSLVFVSASPALASANGEYSDEMVLEEGSVQVGDYEVPFLETSGRVTRRGKTVLFLHGVAFGKQNWADNGILQSVAASGNRAISVDLPRDGFAPPADIDPGLFLRDTIAALGINPSKLVLVSPSYSGFYSLGMLNQFPSMRLAAFVPVAPKDVENFETLSRRQAAKTPTLIAWAASDNRIPTHDPELGAEALRSKIRKSRIKLYDSTSHSFYFETPELSREFSRDITFLARYGKRGLRYCV